MAGAKRVQWRRGVQIVGLLLFLGLTALIDVVALREPVGTDPKDALISLSAIPPVVLWMGCWRLAFARRSGSTGHSPACSCGFTSRSRSTWDTGGRIRPLGNTPARSAGTATASS